MSFGNQNRPSRLRIIRDVRADPLGPNRTPTLVWNIPELREAIVQYCDPASMRKLAMLSLQHFISYNHCGWQELNGLQHIFRLLDDSLDARPTGPGLLVVTIPYHANLQQDRIFRFLDRASAVEVVKINANPNRWIKWDSLDRLLPLIEGIHDRQAIFPNARSCIIHVGQGTQQLKVAPLVKLVANSKLRTLWVKPFSSATHPSCPTEDAIMALSAVQNAQGPAPRLEWLSIFPETTMLAPQLRETFLDHFTQASTRLTHCTLSAWVLSVRALVILLQLPLLRLEVQGRFGAESGDLTFAESLELPKQAFSSLQSLVVSHVPAGLGHHLLATPRILANITMLRVEVFPMEDWFVNEDKMYAGILTQAIRETPNLRNLCLISSQREGQDGYLVGAQLIQSLVAKPLDVLRLYRFRLEGLGFSMHLEGAEAAWGNLHQLAVMHHDLTLQDISCLSELPNLRSLSGNASWPLGERRVGLFAQGFAQQLNLTSQFRFGQRFRSAPENELIILRICCLLVDICPNGLSVYLDKSVGEQGVLREDLDWGTRILRRLSACGVMVFPSLT